MVPKYVDESDNEQNWATNCKQPKKKKVRNCCMFKRATTILVAVDISSINKVYWRSFYKIKSYINFALECTTKFMM